MNDKGQVQDQKTLSIKDKDTYNEDFVLEKTIFSNIFEKDIRRVFIYKKAERLAKAIHLVTPAFASSPPLQNRIDTAAMSLVDAATLPPAQARTRLSRELLALSSILAIARTTGILSPMNIELIAREAHLLLQEIAAYEEPRLSLPDSQSLSELLRKAGKENVQLATRTQGRPLPHVLFIKGHSAQSSRTSRREAILDVLKSKDRAYIKDISTAVRGVSEKTIQRELQALIKSGEVAKQGERRWTLYYLKPA